MAAPKLKSPVARAAAPVVAGVVALGLIALALWGVAAYVSRHSERVKVNTDLAGRYFKPGGVDRLSKQIAKGGPLLFPSLIGDSGRKPIGIGHVGDDPLKGWKVYSLVPPGSPADCLLALDRASGELAAPCTTARYPADGTGLTVLPVTAVTIDPDKNLVIDLRPLAPVG